MCIPCMIKRLAELADQLDKRGQFGEANKIDDFIITQYAISGPKKVKEYYEDCMKDRKHDKEYCARVAWSIYCSNVNPDYKGCTEYGRKWGRPYSGLVSKKKKKKQQK